MTTHDDEMIVSVLLAIAETLNNSSTGKVVLTREQATVLVRWFARELFGCGWSPPDQPWWDVTRPPDKT
jgi:hypothetical protein